MYTYIRMYTYISMHTCMHTYNVLGEAKGSRQNPLPPSSLPPLSLALIVASLARALSLPTSVRDLKLPVYEALSH